MVVYHFIHDGEVDSEVGLTASTGQQQPYADHDHVLAETDDDKSHNDGGPGEYHSEPASHVVGEVHED